MREVKIYLASWRQSADTGANACGSKVIGGRIYDACFVFCLVFVELLQSRERRAIASSASLAGISAANSAKNPGVTYVATNFLTSHM